MLYEINDELKTEILNGKKYYEEYGKNLCYCKT